jgi:ABC-2 type transport system ATP-binding protein
LTSLAQSGKKLTIEVHQVQKRYKDFEALRGVSFGVESGEFFGLLGPNGAGKTTLISIIAGLSRPSGGFVKVNGFDVVNDYRQARRSLGVVPQELVFDPFFTVRETLRFTSGYYGLKNNDTWIDEILANLDLTDKAESNMRSLSGGMKRRVLVAQALVHKPPVIILDEPTAGVDVELRQTLWAFIRRLNVQGHTIVLTTHYLEEAQELCTRIAMLKAGQVVALDQTSKMIHQFAGAKLRLTLKSEAQNPLVLKALAGKSLVVSQVQKFLEIGLENFQQVESVLATVRSAQGEIEELELMHTDLEDVFVKIMQSNSA